MGTLIEHKVLTGHFAQAHPSPFFQFVGRGYHQYEPLAMHRDNLEGRVPANRQTKKSNINSRGERTLRSLREGPTADPVTGHVRDLQLKPAGAVEPDHLPIVKGRIRGELEFSFIMTPKHRSKTKRATSVDR